MNSIYCDSMAAPLFRGAFGPLMVQFGAARMTVVDSIMPGAVETLPIKVVSGRNLAESS